MRAKLTWRVPRWSQAAWVERRDAIRARYGEPVAEAIEIIAHMVRERRDRPRVQDIKATLRRIADRPQDADLRRLDGYTEADLATTAWTRYGTTDLRALPHDSLAACARLALLRRKRGSGPSATDDLALLMVRTLLRLAPDDYTPAQRDGLLSDALLACGLGAGDKTVQRLLTKAGQDS